MCCTSHATDSTRLSPNRPPATPRRPLSASIMARLTRRKIKALTARIRIARARSIVPFHLHADLAGRIGADVAGHLGVLEHLDLDHAAARISRGALAGTDIDTGGDV